MLNESWYPTPEKLANKIRYMIDWDKVNNILDPSAGRGDLLIHVIGDPNVDNYRRNSDLEKGDIQVRPLRQVKNIYAIEIDPSLRGALSKIKFCEAYSRTPQPIKIIGSDFLNYNGFYEIDCIVMNPPFNQGAEHLLKAMDLIRKGQIYCILNKETINNPFSATRKLLNKKIEEHKGEVIDLGKPFTIQAERKTVVECVLVKLYIDKKQIFINLDCFEKMSTANNEDESKQFAVNLDDEKCVVARDEIKMLVAGYQKKIELYKEFLQSIAKLRYYGGKVLQEEIEDYPYAFNKYIAEVTKESWEKLINLNRFSRFMTKEVREEFFKHVSNNSYLEFTEENILTFLDSLVYSFEEIMETSLEGLFDKMTSFDKKNTVEKEGWWTNDSFRVNKKIIIPRIWPRYSFGNYGQLDLDKERLFNDIDRVMMYISGDRLEDINNPDGDDRFRNKFKGSLYEVIDTKYHNKEELFNVKHESHFFKFRLYMKPNVGGTIHLEFKDEKLWQEFNLRAALRKNWLPDDYKARRKENMKRGLFLEFKESA